MQVCVVDAVSFWTVKTDLHRHPWVQSASCHKPAVSAGALQASRVHLSKRLFLLLDYFSSHQTISCIMDAARAYEFWRNSRLAHSLLPVVRTEILCILVHIVWEPPRSVVVIVCSLKKTAKSLWDLAHSAWIVLVWDLLIDCVHCDPLSFCLLCTLERLFYFRMTCLLHNMHSDTDVSSSRLLLTLRVTKGQKAAGMGGRAPKKARQWLCLTLHTCVGGRVKIASKLGYDTGLTWAFVWGPPGTAVGLWMPGGRRAHLTF